MSSSVKGIFPSISITKKKGKQPSSGPTPSTSNAQSLPFLRSLTPESLRKQTPSASPSEPLRSFPARGASPNPSPLQSRKPNSVETNLSALENGIQLSQSTPDLRLGVRHVRSTSQPTKPVAGTSHRESFSSVTFPDRSNSVNSDTSYYTEAAEAPMIVQEDIIALTFHVRTFSEALSSLRNTFIECEDNPEGEPPEVKAHERLGEVLSVLKGVLNKYQPLHSTEILASAGTLISKVKSHNYEDTSKAPDEFYESIDQLALAFSSSVSDFLMGEQEMVLSESMSKQYSRSLEDFGDEDDEDVDDRGYDEDNEDDQDYLDEQGERRLVEKKESVDTSAEKADELDRALIQLEHGVDIAMQRTKIWAKYSKDIETYVDKRAHLELEFTNKLSKLALTTRAAIMEENYLPFQSIFVTALDQDIDYADNANKTYASLMSSRFMEPLTARRNNHEKRRKDLKDAWAKALKKVNEAAANLKKAKALYIQKQQELEKEGAKKKEGDHRKAEEAEEYYRSSVTEANSRQRELENTKSNILVELRQLIYQCDQTMKAVTCNYFQMMNALAASAPVQFQTLAESSRNYEPGSQFSEFVRLQQANSPQAVEQVFYFEPYSAGSSDKGQQTPSRHNSLFDSKSSDKTHLPIEENVKMSPFNSRRHKSLQLHGSHNVNSSQQPMNAWSHLKEHNSDAESTTSRSLPGSPSNSPTSARKQADIPRAQSLELISSDDGENKDERRRNGPVNTSSRRKRPSKNRTGPFQNTRQSASAQTHTLKKLRSASKCRECDSYVYFNGAECEVCGLTCHKKCLGRLNIKCGTYNKVQRRMTTFGVDFYRHLQDSNTEEENIPHIISSCIDEIDSRGLDVKGIYRVSGVKSRVEKLCQSFENGEYQADMSDTPPHVIAAVLKLYLRQLPESLLTVKLYPDFIRIAKESFALIDNSTTCKDASENDEIREEYDKLIGKLREVVMQLPTANRVTAARVISHLRRVSEHHESNAMPGSNLAIVFGPTLLRPCEHEATSTLSSLVDMPHQTRLVELLIACPGVFELPDSSTCSISRETPVEKFTPPKPRERECSLVAIQSIRSPAGTNNQDESYEAGDEASLINTPDTNGTQSLAEYSSLFPRSQSSPAGINVPQLLTQKDIPKSPSPSTKSSLGFGTEFFELLAKSNNRSDGPSDRSQYSIPEFLLPETQPDRPDVTQEDSDMEDEYEDDTTQGTSGSRTPDDDLDASHFGAPQRINSPRSSTENLVDDDKTNTTTDYSFSLMSRSSSAYSFAPSFSSDFPDTDSLLPDLSDNVGSGKFNASGGVGNPDRETRILDHQPESQSESRTRSLSGNTGVPQRPRTLGLLKRNSDLPGRVQRVDEFNHGFFPIGMTSSKSDGNLCKDPIEEEESIRAISEIASSSSNTVTSTKSDELEKESLIDADYLREAATIININTDEVSMLEGGRVSPIQLPSEDTFSPLQSPTEEKFKELHSPSRAEPPPVSKKPARSPSAETKDFEYSVSAAEEEAPPLPEMPVEAGSRELIIPVMTALQERRSSTPNCSTAEATSDIESPDRLENPVITEKKSEAKPMTRSAYTTRVSVKDRLQQYERNRSSSLDANRKTSSELFTPNSVASRKQIFEKRGVYKRVSDMGTRKPRSDSGSGSGSASGSPKLSRKQLIDSEDGKTVAAAEVQVESNLDRLKPTENEKHDELPRRRHKKDKSENTERPRSLILDRLRLESLDSSKPDRQRAESLKLDLHDSGSLSPREIDIPIDNEFDVRHRSERPRRSPTTSPRSSRINARSPFPDDSNEEDREPQFV